MDPLLDAGYHDLEAELLRAGSDVQMSPELENKILMGLGVGGTALAIGAVTGAHKLAWLGINTWPQAVKAAGLFGLATAGAFAVASQFDFIASPRAATALPQATAPALTEPVPGPRQPGIELQQNHTASAFQLHSPDTPAATKSQQMNPPITKQQTSDAEKNETINGGIAQGTTRGVEGGNAEMADAPTHLQDHQATQHNRVTAPAERIKRRQTSLDSAASRRASSDQDSPRLPPSTAGSVSDSRPRASASAPRASAGGLGEEVRLLGSASEALAAGNASLALKRVANYRSAFPRAKLSLEAEALTIQALARNGQRDKARSRAVQFVKRYPQSPLVARLRKYAN